MEGFKVLVAEDEADLAEVFAGFLELKGCKDVWVVATGEAAIAKIREEKPDFVFLDIQLADNTDGVEVLRQARGLSPDTKVIMMSAYYKEYNQITADLGAYCFLRKPFTAEALDRLLSDLLGKK